MPQPAGSGPLDASDTVVMPQPFWHTTNRVATLSRTSQPPAPVDIHAPDGRRYCGQAVRISALAKLDQVLPARLRERLPDPAAFVATAVTSAPYRYHSLR
jgi:hypothetical protein